MDTPPDAGLPAPEAPPPPPVRPVDDLLARNLGEADEEETAAEAILRMHGVEEGEKIVYGKLLTEPITPAERTDTEALEERRLALLEEAKDIQNLNSRVKRAHQAADKEYKETIRLKKAFEEKLATAEALQKKVRDTCQVRRREPGGVPRT